MKDHIQAIRDMQRELTIYELRPQLQELQEQNKVLKNDVETWSAFAQRIQDRYDNLAGRTQTLEDEALSAEKAMGRLGREKSSLEARNSDLEILNEENVKAGRLSRRLWHELCNALIIAHGSVHHTGPNINEIDLYIEIVSALMGYPPIHPLRETVPFSSNVQISKDNLIPALPVMTEIRASFPGRWECPIPEEPQFLRGTRCIAQNDGSGS